MRSKGGGQTGVAQSFHTNNLHGIILKKCSDGSVESEISLPVLKIMPEERLTDQQTNMRDQREGLLSIILAAACSRKGSKCRIDFKEKTSEFSS